MKIKNLLFILFALYWVIVYGVSFFSSKESKSKYRQFFPTGYYMFSSLNHTSNDALYRFYNKGELKDEVILSEYLNNEYEKSLLSNKVSWVKERMYLGRVKALDSKYQYTLYTNAGGDASENSFENLISESEESKNVIQNLKNFSVEYLKENPNLISDSVSILVGRAPVKVIFAPDYSNNFTYSAGEGVFYMTYQKF